MRRERLLLREMIDAAEGILEAFGDSDAAEVRADRIRRAAILWQYTVLGEAANQIDVDFRATHPNIDWSAPTRLRNKIVHSYWDVSFEILHDTAKQVLPAFIDALSTAIDELPDESD